MGGHLDGGLHCNDVMQLHQYDVMLILHNDAAMVFISNAYSQTCSCFVEMQTIKVQLLCGMHY